MKILPLRPGLFHANRGTDGWTEDQTDRYDEADRPVLKYCESAYRSLEAACIVFFANVLFARIFVQTVTLYCLNVCFKFSSFLQSSDWTCG